MSVFTSKPGSKAVPKLSGAIRQAAVPQPLPVDGAIRGTGSYHYARSPLQRRAKATPAAGMTEAGHANARPAGGMRSTGLPVGLRTGIQALSGLSLDRVKVHYNSFQPAQLNAHAYAQGDEIHLAPGQEQHLAHEAWHVVQQREGRAHATGRIGGQALNDDAGLEREADLMGSEAASIGAQAAPPLRQRSLSAPSNPPIQGYFIDESKKSPFGSVKASKRDVDLVRDYLTSRVPDLLEEFNQAANDEKTAHGSLQGWLRSKGLPTLEQIRFPQIRNVSPSWITSTTTPNDGGPSILLEPGDIDSPASSQEQDIALDGLPQSTDLVVDLTRDALPYHRGGTIPIDDATRSEVRAGAMLTNEYIDFSPTPLVGRGTDSISAQTQSLRKRARDHDPGRSKDRTYSHHPDTFWTGVSYSPMGWHPVGKHTNTLDGDYQKLTSRGGKRLTGMVTKERGGYMRPSLTAHNASQARDAKARALRREVDGADLAKLMDIHARAEELAVTKKARELWREIERALIYARDVIAGGMGDELAKRISVYLEIGFDQTPRSTSTVASLFDAIADRLKSLGAS